MYSLDFINIVIKAYNNRKSLNMTVDKIAKFYNISKQSIYNWIGNNFNTKNNKRQYVRSTVKSEYEKKYINYLLNYVKENPQFIINKLIYELNTLFGISLSKKVIYMILKKNKITRKRVQVNKYPHSTEKYLKDLKILRKKINKKKNRIISIDETSIEINEINNYGLSSAQQKGSRCIINKRNKNKGFKFSLLFGISKNKIIGYAIKEGSFKGPDFNNFMNKIDIKNGKYSYLL